MKNPQNKRMIKTRVARIYLEDHQKSVVLGDGTLKETMVACEDCDISLGSAALDYVLAFAWGGDTLQVNARFQLPPNGKYNNFRFFAYIASLNNRGLESVGQPSLLRRACRKLRRILGV